MFTEINRIYLMTCNIHTKSVLSRIHYLDAILFTHIHTHMHTYITVKIVLMKFRNLKTYDVSKPQNRIFLRLKYFPYLKYMFENKIIII